MDIANMHLDKRNAYPRQRVSDADAGMGERSSIDNDVLTVPSCFLNAVDNGSLVVGLERVYSYAQVRALLFRSILYILKSGAAVDLRLSSP